LHAAGSIVPHTCRCNLFERLFNDARVVERQVVNQVCESFLLEVALNNRKAGFDWVGGGAVGKVEERQDAVEVIQLPHGVLLVDRRVVHVERNRLSSV